MNAPNVCAPQTPNLTAKAREEGFQPTPELQYRVEMTGSSSMGGWGSSREWSTLGFGGSYQYPGAVSVLQQKWVNQSGETRWLDVPYGAP